MSKPAMFVGGGLASPMYVMLPDGTTRHRLSFYMRRDEGGVGRIDARAFTPSDPALTIREEEFAQTGLVNGTAYVFAPDGDVGVAANWLGKEIMQPHNVRCLVMMLAATNAATIHEAPLANALRHLRNAYEANDVQDFIKALVG